MWWWATTSAWPVALAISIVVVVIVAIVTIVVVAIVAIMMVAIVAIVIVSIVAIVIMAIVTVVVIAIVAIVLSPPSVVVVVVVLPFSLADSCPVPWCPARIAVGISCRAMFSRVRWFSTSLAIPAISAPSVVVFVIVGPFFPLVRTIPFFFFVVTALLFVF